MAIEKIERKSGNRFQVKVRGSDGKWITKSFDTYGAANKYEAQLKLKKAEGEHISNSANQMTVDQYFSIWFEEVKATASVGWRNDQANRYNKYISPVIGNKKLNSVNPALVARVLRFAAETGISEQTVRHIYSLIHKVFGDAVDLFQYLTVSPVLKKLRPKVPEKETAHLSVDQVVQLLKWVDGKTYDIAIWLGVYVGLRVGEVMALQWKHVDLDLGIIHVRCTYSRKEKVIRDYPKGRRWHSHSIPIELLMRLKAVKARATSEFVAPSPNKPMLSYDGYYDALQRYCLEAGVPIIGTHGLRHSTAGVYMAHGATRDDLRKLFAHSSSAVTDRYIHDKGERVDQVAKVIQLFPQNDMDGTNPTKLPCSINVPHLSKIKLEQKEGTC